jgi:hypothetical protein
MQSSNYIRSCETEFINKDAEVYKLKFSIVLKGSNKTTEIFTQITEQDKNKIIIILIDALCVIL